ncbi:MAG: hypothetical protein FJX72_09580, partial [Armatimonadetes bacterium]|nr:hypothetical protein [Armatimonadota bacterium]
MTDARGVVLALACTLAFALPFAARSGRPDAVVTIAYQPQLWAPDGGDATRQGVRLAGIETNGHYIRRRQSGADRAEWRRALARVRTEARRSPTLGGTSVRYRGVRAWIRLRAEIGAALQLRPGEQVRVDIVARRLSGNPEICCAFDFLDRRTSAWRGWSTVVGTARLPEDGSWGRVALTATVPPPSSPRAYANPIIGQDATHDPAVGEWEVRSITLHVPDRPGRSRAIAVRKSEIGEPPPIAAGYDRKDLAWASRNFACLFLFLYDTEAYDRKARRYRTDQLVARWRRDFGGVDSVVLWQAYPRIGVDPRNQFDFYRDMPGGLKGLRRLVDDLHRHGIRSFLAYNPWDTGTRREAVSDADAVARMVRDLDADGVFLDTMMEAPAGLRRAVDAARPGVVFEPEGVPPIEQLGLCSSSWAQGLPEYPEPGVLLLKWIEPRHMQHQVRR